jgi:hypothetical protein
MKRIVVKGATTVRIVCPGRLESAGVKAGKSIKRIVSATFVKDLDYLKEIIESSFRKCAVHIGYARK